MGLIQQTSTGQTRLLEPEHLVGRAPTCSLRINERFVSAQHAMLRWTGEYWDLKDLGSRNGTFLDGNRIKSGEETAVQKGSTIAFGKPEQQWELLDISPPTVMAVTVDSGDAVTIDGELLALPSSEDPQVTIYPGLEGGWLLEQPNESITAITHLQTFEIAGHTWRFSCPEHTCRTSLANYSSDFEVRHLELLFSVSRDEEHVQLHATYGTGRFDLGARNHHYTLLILARQRLSDATEGLPETSCGWTYLEDLLSGSNKTPSELNIDVYRIRKQFDAIGVLDAANIIERRPRTKQLRIGTGRIFVQVL